MINYIDQYTLRPMPLKSYSDALKTAKKYNFLVMIRTCPNN